MLSGRLSLPPVGLPGAILGGRCGLGTGGARTAGRVVVGGGKLELGGVGASERGAIRIRIRVSSRAGSRGAGLAAGGVGSGEGLLGRALASLLLSDAGVDGAADSLGVRESAQT